VELEAGGRKQALGPGDSFAVPAGVPHRWRVAGDEEAHFFVELDDPRTFEEQLETLFALGRAGALRPGGEVPLPLVACLALDHLDSGYLAGPPLAVQRVLLGALRGVARLTGHRTTYDRARAEARERLSVLAYISAA
jgi:hypothetical protein